GGHRGEGGDLLQRGEVGGVPEQREEREQSGQRGQELRQEIGSLRPALERQQGRRQPDERDGGVQGHAPRAGRGGGIGGEEEQAGPVQPRDLFSDREQREEPR